MSTRFYMKGVRRFALALCLICLLLSSLETQDRFKEAIKQLSSDNVIGYVQPMIDGFGANINSGFPGSAQINRFGVHVRLDFILMGSYVGDREKEYFAMPPQPFPQEPVKAATVFGGSGTVLNHPSGVRYNFQNGQIQTSIIPFAVPQITIGNMFGTQLVVRYIPTLTVEDFPDVGLFGAGIRHSISQYVPLVPVDIALGLFYQSFTISDNFDSKAFAVITQVSRTFQVLTIYGGLQYEITDVTLSYTYAGWPPPQDPSDRSVSVNFKGKNNFRLKTGAEFSLGLLHLNADLNFGKVTVLSAGVGFGI